MSIEAMKQAYKAMADIHTPLPLHEAVKLDAAGAALRQAIEQAEKQEPVAWMVYTLDGKSAFVTDNPADFTDQNWRALPLYTAPQQRKPLTDEQVDELARTMVKGDKSVNWLCQAIEAAHGIKEEA